MIKGVTRKRKKLEKKRKNNKAIIDENKKN